MKKTMFITSVIMVVVMAIALTTSSLAWFSASGSNDVTTTALSVTAKAVSSAGIQISTDQSVWASNINLAANDTVGSMDPAMPYAYVDTQSSETYTALDSILNGKFITNTVNQNNKYDGTASTSPVVFSNTFYITNISSGSASSVGPKVITASIKFTDADGNYEYNSLDALLNVAILVDQNVTLTSGDTNYPTEESADWKILKLFKSSQATGANIGEYISTSEANVNFGGAEELFANGGNATSSGNDASWSSTSVASATVNTSSALQPIYQNNTIGEVKQFKVVAWYDGASLKNSNSGGTIKFELKFTASDAS